MRLSVARGVYRLQAVVSSKRVKIEELERACGNQTYAAQLLGLNRDQVRYRIEKFGIQA